MTTRKSDDTKRADSLPGEAELSRVYRHGGEATPPAALDAQILAEARRAVAKPGARRAFGSNWAVPLSTAAVMVLTLGILLVVSEQSPLDRHDQAAPVPSEPPALSTYGARSDSPAPATAPNDVQPQSQQLKDTASPLPSREVRRETEKGPVDLSPDERARMVPPRPGGKRGGEGEKAVAAGKTDLPESTPGANTLLRASPPAEEAKKAERATTGAAAPAPRRERLADERDVGAAQGEFRAKTKVAKEAKLHIAADVIAVQVSGAPGAYQFDVTIQSPDTGCQQYADWWEVVSADGTLLYRRVLAHSHVNEQPFTRAGGPVPVQPDTVVWVRAHMSATGYGGVALKGSVRTGFQKAELDSTFAAELTAQLPRPEGCAF